MFGASIGRGAMRIINAMVRALASFGIAPNILTATGVTRADNNLAVFDKCNVGSNTELVS